MAEAFQANRDAELREQKFTSKDVDAFDAYEARQDVLQAVRKDLVPLQIEARLNQSYDRYFESGCGDVSWTGGSK